LKESSFAYDDTTVASLVSYSGMLSQKLFEPFDVAGWQRDRTWINTNFMIGRWLTIQTIFQDFFDADDEQFRSFGLSVSGNDGLTSNNPDLIARQIIDFILSKGLLNEAEYEKAFTIFRGDIPPQYFEGGSSPVWTLATAMEGPTQVFQLLQYLARQPEFQLK
jgi:hypothetical protein